MKIATARLMSLDELRNRLRDRLEHLRERMKTIPRETDAQTYSNVRTELNTTLRRLKLLEEKVSQGKQCAE